MLRLRPSRLGFAPMCSKAGAHLPLREVAHACTHGPPIDAAAPRASLAAAGMLITYESRNIPTSALIVEAAAPIHPGRKRAESVRPDAEKGFLTVLGSCDRSLCAVEDAASLRRRWPRCRIPAILKTRRRFGYTEKAIALMSIRDRIRLALTDMRQPCHSGRFYRFQTSRSRYRCAQCSGQSPLRSGRNVHHDESWHTTTSVPA